jgi:hypothetical protein
LLIIASLYRQATIPGRRRDYLHRLPCFFVAPEARVCIMIITLG